MNNYNSASMAYMGAKVKQTSKPEELTMILYDELVRKLMLSKKGIETKDFKIANDAIIKCQDILDYLINTLNPEIKISKDMESLYDYMNYQLLKANLTKNSLIVNEVYSLAKEFQQAWRKSFNLK